jgi:hypothetical protein
VKVPTILRKTGGNTTGFELAPEVVGALGGGRRPPVNVTLNGTSTCRTAIAPTASSFCIGISAGPASSEGAK